MAREGGAISSDPYIFRALMKGTGLSQHPNQTQSQSTSAELLLEILLIRLALRLIANNTLNSTISSFDNKLVFHPTHRYSRHTLRRSGRMYVMPTISFTINQRRVRLSLARLIGRKRMEVLAHQRIGQTSFFTLLFDGFLPEFFPLLLLFELSQIFQPLLNQ